MSQPNVIWIFGDQHRAQALGCNGDENVYTPNIDTLATGGINFKSAVSGAPLCSPFRGSLLTGVYPHDCVPGHECQLPPNIPTIANVFNENDYDTAYFGKWHVDGFKEERWNRATMHIIPKERRGGFKTFIGYENNNSQWDTWVHGHYDDEEIEQYRLKGYETDELTDLLINFINKKGKDKTPFFAALSVQPPHNPQVAPAEFMGKHTPGKVKLRPNVPDVDYVKERAKRECSGYYAMIENLDYNVGRIRQALYENGLDLNTHIMFFSDHGDMLGSHGQFAKTAPYEEAIRVPFIIGGEYMHYYNGRRCGDVDAVINHVDIAPTTLGLCGINKPDHMMGTDYSHYRLGTEPKETEPDSAFIGINIPTGHHDSIDKPWRGIVTRDGFKYVCFEGMSWLMFDLNTDPYEQVNLVHNSKFKEKRAELLKKLGEWIEKTGDSFILPQE